MGDAGFIIEYVRSCTVGVLRASDCGPLWQFAMIAGILLVAIVTLVILRLRVVARER